MVLIVDNNNLKRQTNMHLTNRQKISRAIDHVFAHHGLLASTVAGWHVRQASEVRGQPIENMATDGVNLYYNDEYLDKCGIAEVSWLLLKCAGHVWLGHHLRLTEEHQPWVQVCHNLALNSLIERYCPNGSFLKKDLMFPGIGAFENLNPNHESEHYWRELFEGLEPPPSNSGGQGDGEGGEGDEQGEGDGEGQGEGKGQGQGNGEGKGKGQGGGNGSSGDDNQQQDGGGGGGDSDSDQDEQEEGDQEDTDGGEGGEGNDDPSTSDTQQQNPGNSQHQDKPSSKKENEGDDGDGDPKDTDSKSDGDSNPNDAVNKPDIKDRQGTTTTKDGRQVPTNSAGNVLPHPKLADEQHSEVDAKEAEADWRQQNAQSVVLFKACGDSAGAMVEVMDTVIERSEVDWRTILRRFMTKVTRTGHSYTRPNRRTHGVKDLILPSRRSRGSGKGLVIVDTSGSMGLHECNSALSEIEKILNTFRKSEVDMMQCDTRAVGEMITFHKEDFPLEVPVAWAGRGGTNLDPAFEFAAKHSNEYKWVVCITDMMWAVANATNPRLPVMWCSTDIGWDHLQEGWTKPEFGEFIKIDINIYEEVA